MSFFAKAGLRIPAHVRRGPEKLRLTAMLISTASQAASKKAALANLAKTDWGEIPLCLEYESGEDAEHATDLRARCALVALGQCLDSSADYILFLEGNMHFNLHLRANLSAWNPVKMGTMSVASLFNPGVRELACDLPNNARIVHPNHAVNGRALLLSKNAAAHFVRRWNKLEGTLEHRLSRLTASLRNPVLYHSPSLVQIITPDPPIPKFMPAMDFIPRWRASDDAQLLPQTAPRTNQVAASCHQHTPMFDSH
jgi:hypothetical protein